ncbi:MAG: DUF1931 domain-containing protein [Candidatus Aenigmarchaeota archaeon]|nr:DUF1931 domain-containing protein [Candidatus Aenigmarchaeota archaeon]
MGEMLVVQSKVREIAKKADANVGSDFVDNLSKKVEEMIEEAVNRAKANGRKTLRGYDL